MPPSMHVQSYNAWLTEGFNLPYDHDLIFESLMKLNKDMLLILIKVFAGTMPFPQFVMMGYSKSELVHLLIGYMDNDPGNQADNDKGKGKGKGNVVVLPQPHGGTEEHWEFYNYWLHHGIESPIMRDRVDKSLKNLDRTTLLILIHVVSAGVHPLVPHQVDVMVDSDGELHRIFHPQTHMKEQLIGTLMEYMVHDNVGLVSKGKGKGKGGPPPPAPPPHQDGAGSDDDGYIVETVIIQQEGGDQQQEGVGSDDGGVVYIGGEQHFVDDDHTGDQSDGSDESASS